MIPRHVRIKKLPAKHKQSQVSAASGQWGWGSGQGQRAAAGRGSCTERSHQAGRPTLSQGGCKAWGLKQGGRGCGKARGQPRPEA